ncbi:MAG TPA: protein kinase [Parachlamydiaceae bacterium]|nr:protein kinase [Parachlamydiaceae bacterium]
MVPLVFCKEIKLVEGPAKMTYNKEGTFVDEGSLDLRIHFCIFGNSDQFDFICKKESSEDLNGTVPFEINGERVHFLVSDCSDRLHISKAKILEHSKNNTLGELFERKIDQFAVLDQIVNTYASIIKNYKDEYSVPIPNNEKQIFVQKSALMKIVHLFHLYLSKNSTVPFSIHLSPKTRKKHSTEISKILAFQSLEHPCFLVDVSSPQDPIEGNFSTVSRVTCISHRCFFAIKQSKKNYLSYRDVKKEIVNRELLKDLKLTENVIFPYFIKDKPSKKVTVFSPYCNKRDLAEFTANIEDGKKRVGLFIKPFTSLIKTLAIWHKNHIVHRDIKPENILVDQQKDGGLVFYIGDLAETHQAKSNKSFFVDTYTPCYSPTYSGVKLSPEKHMKRDIFQLGMTITFVFTNKIPYQKNNKFDDFPDFSISFDKTELLKICSLEVTKLLESMCHQNSAMRPSMEQVFSTVSNPSFKWEISS